MKKLIILFAYIIAFTQCINAQDTVYFQRGAKNTATKHQKRSSERNIIKLSPISFINGFVPVYFERELNSTFAIQVGAGITTRNYLKDWTRKVDEDNPDVTTTKWNDGTVDQYFDENDYSSYKKRKSVMGYYVAVEPRVYLDNEGLDGSFIGISFSRANYKYNMQKVQTGPSITGEPVFLSSTFSEVENVTDVLATYGYQTLYDKVSVEYNIGLGLRKLTGSRYAYGVNNVGSYVDGVSTLDKTKLGFNFSIKVGYHF
jgi:hypothetical protein